MTKSRVTVFSSSSTLTQRLGAVYAQHVVATQKKRPIIIFLQGDLGSGKTTFVRGFLKNFGVTPRGASPTFVLVKHYSIRRRGMRAKDIYHYDAYRLSSSRDLAVLGFADVAHNPEAIVLIEWPEKISGYGVRATYRVRFTYGDAPHERLLSFS
ncbi:MAG: tRNA (adenosine(37)-N6)-threonylcarbamoyltransferase complex ATPase subunit type 1 TsaE [Candidatus Paceibacterota bacterium]|jgi:tRNA threonylcarbamoyladenosine biosynthesis protein TsaE